MKVTAAGESDVRDYLRVLRRRKWTVVFVLVAVVAAVLGYSYWQTPKYTATAQVVIQSSGTAPQLNSSVTTVLQPSDIQTQVQLVTSAPVKAAVAQKVGSAPGVSVDPVGQTDVIEVAATSTDRTRAAAIANAYVNAYVDFRRTQAVTSLLAASQQIQAKITDLDNQIAALDARASHAPSSQQSGIVQSQAPQRSALVDQESAFKSQQAQLQVNSAVETGAAQVVAPASVPTSPSSPRIVRNALLAAAVGLLLGIALAFLRDYLDDSIKTKEDLERASGGLPVLGHIPAVSSWKDKSQARVVSLTEPTSPAAEAYRAIRTSIQFLGLDRPVRTLQITSPAPGEGKTTTVANLGVALAGAGQRVLIVCGDLRRPRIDEFFGLSHEVGFTSVLLGRLPLSEACQRVPGVERLAVLAPGPLPANPSEALVSRQTVELLEAAKAEADVVLVDSPPVLSVTDAVILSTRVDATLLVASAGATSAKMIARSLEVLDQVGTSVVGTVLNGVTVDEAYGYAYRYKYYQSDLPSLAGNGSHVPANGDPRQSHIRLQ